MSCKELDMYQHFLAEMTSFQAKSNLESLYKSAAFKLDPQEIIGELLCFSLKFLSENKCPAKLIHPIIDDITKNFSKSEADSSNTELCSQLNIKQFVLTTVQNFCTKLLDNIELNKVLSGLNHKESDDSWEPLHVSASSKNKRRFMEDRHICIDNFNSIYINSDEKVSFYAVLDGHDGFNASSYAVSQLPKFLAAHDELYMDPINSLSKAFLETDQHFIEKSVKGGSTVVCALHFPETSRLYIAWVGDSKALLVKQNQILQVVKPHKPDDEQEKARINNAGGSVIRWEGIWRVDGLLNLSRAIGDSRCKPYVTANPDIMGFELDKNEDFLILGSDGLWDHVEEEHIAYLVYENLSENVDLEKIPEILIEKAKAGSSCDNITVVIVFFKPPSVIAKNYLASKSKDGESNFEKCFKETNELSNQNKFVSNILKTPNDEMNNLLGNGDYTEENLMSPTFINRDTENFFEKDQFLNQENVDSNANVDQEENTLENEKQELEFSEKQSNTQIQESLENLQLKETAQEQNFEKDVFSPDIFGHGVTPAKPHFNLQDDVVSQSPKKTINMENILIPENNDFDVEITERPHEVSGELLTPEEENQSLGGVNKQIQDLTEEHELEKEFTPNSPPNFNEITKDFPHLKGRLSKIKDDIITQSPRKSIINMEDVPIPDEKNFDEEAIERPHELENELLIPERNLITDVLNEETQIFDVSKPSYLFENTTEFELIGEINNEMIQRKENDLNLSISNIDETQKSENLISTSNNEMLLDHINEIDGSNPLSPPKFENLIFDYKENNDKHSPRAASTEIDGINFANFEVIDMDLNPCTTEQFISDAENMIDNMMKTCALNDDNIKNEQTQSVNYTQVINEASELVQDFTKLSTNDDLNVNDVKNTIEAVNIINFNDTKDVEQTSPSNDNSRESQYTNETDLIEKSSEFVQDLVENNDLINGIEIKANAENLNNSKDSKPISPLNNINGEAAKLIYNLNDDIVAQSPRKSSLNMEDIMLPEDKEFDKEVSLRPHEVADDDLFIPDKVMENEIMNGNLNNESLEKDNTENQQSLIKENGIELEGKLLFQKEENISTTEAEAVNNHVEKVTTSENLSEIVVSKDKKATETKSLKTTDDKKKIGTDRKTKTSIPASKITSKPLSKKTENITSLKKNILGQDKAQKPKVNTVKKMISETTKTNTGAKPKTNLTDKPSSTLNRKPISARLPDKTTKESEAKTEPIRRASASQSLKEKPTTQTKKFSFDLKSDGQTSSALTRKPITTTDRNKLIEKTSNQNLKTTTTTDKSKISEKGAVSNIKETTRSIQARKPLTLTVTRTTTTTTTTTVTSKTNSSKSPTTLKNEKTATDNETRKIKPLSVGISKPSTAFGSKVSSRPTSAITKSDNNVKKPITESTKTTTQIKPNNLKSVSSKYLLKKPDLQQKKSLKSPEASSSKPISNTRVNVGSLAKNTNSKPPPSTQLKKKEVENVEEKKTSTTVLITESVKTDSNIENNETKLN